MHMSRQRISLLSLLPLVLVSLSGVTAPGAHASTQAHAAASAPSMAPAAATARPTREIFGFALASTLGDPSVGYSTWNFSLLSTVAFRSEERRVGKECRSLCSPST